MEIIGIVIGVLGLGFTIWEFIAVRLKKRAVNEGINIKEFTEKVIPNYNFDTNDDEYRIPDESDLLKGGLL